MPTVKTSDIFDRSLLTRAEKALPSPLMRDILGKALHIAELERPVILIGEIGSGKKRMAKIIHENSRRGAFPFHSFYCVDLNEEEYQHAFREQLQIQDEHFILKYEIVEKASPGLLYLDQFSELSADLMINIVRSYLHGCEQLFRYSEKAKPRLVLSVNMEAYPSLIHKPEWHEILQLLDPCALMIPPLRERPEDISILVDAYLEELKTHHEKFTDLSISVEARTACTAYSWPGNIRQLHNALLQGAILSHGQKIESQHLPFSMSWKLPYDFMGNDSKL